MPNRGFVHHSLGFKNMPMAICFNQLKVKELMRMSDNIIGSDVHKLFSNNLKRLRVRAGLSQLSLANEVGLTHNFINDIENGKKWVSPKTIAKLSNKLKVDPYELFVPPSDLDIYKAGLLNNHLDDISESFLRVVAGLKAEYLDDKGPFPGKKDLK